MSTAVARSHDMAAAVPAKPVLASLPAELAADLQAIELSLARTSAGGETRTEEVIRHGLQAGGKRVRPLLSCTLLRALGEDPTPHIDLIVAVELVHTASLFHDDVIDRTDTRRGRAAAHVAYDVPTAIFAGDLLLSMALDRLARSGPRQLQITLAAAVRDLSIGAILEREHRFDLAVDLAHVRRVNRLKTASLFACAAEAATILAGSTREVCRQARSFGTALGEAFQTTDDLLDLCGDPQVMGKPNGQDLVAGEINVPMAIGLATDDGLRDEILEVWQATDQPGSAGTSRLDGIRDRLQRCGALDEARLLAACDGKRASSALEFLPRGRWRSRLDKLVASVAKRER